MKNSLNHLNILRHILSQKSKYFVSLCRPGTRENYADAALRFDWTVSNTRKYNIESRKLSKSVRSWPTIISI